MDFGCVMPEYVYRMRGGAVAIKEITEALNYAKRNCFMSVKGLLSWLWQFCSYLFW